MTEKHTLIYPQRMHGAKNPDPEKDGHSGTGTRPATVPDAGSWLAPSTDQGTLFH